MWTPSTVTRPREDEGMFHEAERNDQMDSLTYRRKQWVREVILRGDDPVKRFRQAGRKEQIYGLAVVAREGVLAERVASFCGFPGAIFLLGTQFLTDVSAGGSLSVFATLQLDPTHPA